MRSGRGPPNRRAARRRVSSIIASASTAKRWPARPGLPPEARAKFAVHKSTDPSVVLPILPVIPLMGTAGERDVPAPTWPTFTEAEPKPGAAANTL